MHSDPAFDAYVAGFRDRVVAMRQPGQEIVDEPGLVGLLGQDAHTLGGRVLVTDDRARDVLDARLPELFARVLYVFDQAKDSREVLSRSRRFRETWCTAMVCDRLDLIADLALPDGLTQRPIATSRDAVGVPVEAAAAAALRSDPRMAPTTNLDDFVGYLRSIPNTRFLAAVDDDGVVRATAAAASWAATAGVFFVNTDPAWRGRGVGTAMTAAVLRAATADGAGRACLDASELGLAIYRRLGFASVGGITQFVMEPVPLT